MNLLFIHGGEKLKEDKDGNYYTDGSYNKHVWDRYLSLSENLTVMFRKDSKIYDTTYAEEKFEYFDKNSITFKELPDMFSSILSFLNVRKRSGIAKNINEEILKNDFLIVRLPSKEGYIALNNAERLNKPYLIEVVGCPWDSLWNHSLKGKILAPINYLSMYKAIKKAEFVTYVTKEFLQSRYPCKGRTLGCSDVLIPHADETVLLKRIDKIKKMSLNRPIVLGTTAAIDVNYKGQEYVIEAIAKLNEAGHNFEYKLVGGGDEGYLRTIAKKYNVLDKVEFLGALPHEQVFNYLDNIDIYIQPSKTEGLPRALIEAMSRGCPSLGSKIGGIPELLSREFVFTKGSVNEICNVLRGISKQKMLEEAERSYVKAKEFDKKVLDSKRITFYKEFIEMWGSR